MPNMIVKYENVICA